MEESLRRLETRCLRSPVLQVTGGHFGTSVGMFSMCNTPLQANNGVVKLLGYLIATAG